MRCKTIIRSPTTGEEEAKREKRGRHRRAPPTVRQTAGGRGRTAIQEQKDK